MTRDKTLEKPFAAGFRRLWAMAFVILGGLFGGSAYWVYHAQVAGAVIASGQIVVEGNTKQIQHSQGGYVAEILVSEGDHVEAGQTLVRLDPTRAEAELAIVSDQLNAAIATEARLIAETADMQDYLIVEEDMLFVEPGEKFDRLAQAQRLLLETREASINGRVRQLEEQKRQIAEQIMGFEAQRAANEVELGILTTELAD